MVCRLFHRVHMGKKARLSVFVYVCVCCVCEQCAQWHFSLCNSNSTAPWNCVHLISSCSIYILHELLHDFTYDCVFVFFVSVSASMLFFSVHLLSCHSFCHHFWHYVIIVHVCTHYTLYTMLFPIIFPKTQTFTHKMSIHVIRSSSHPWTFHCKWCVSNK